MMTKLNTVEHYITSNYQQLKITSIVQSRVSSIHKLIRVKLHTTTTTDITIFQQISQVRITSEIIICSFIAIKSFQAREIKSNSLLMEGFYDKGYLFQLRKKPKVEIKSYYLRIMLMQYFNSVFCWSRYSSNKEEKLNLFGIFQVTLQQQYRLLCIVQMDSNICFPYLEHDYRSKSQERPSTANTGISNMLKTV